jgi:hypothetical protein
MDEIRLLPEDQVSLRKDLYEKMFGRWTEVGTAHTTGIDAIRKELTVNIAQLLPEMQDEVKYALDKEIGSCPDWTRITLLPHLMQLSALTNGRFFVGPLCRDQNWINLSLSYSVNIMGSVKTLQTYNKIVRPLVAPFLPQLRKLDQHKTQADHMLRPYIAAALDARKVKTADGKEAGSELHLISWMLNHVDTAKKIDTNMLAREQLFIGRWNMNGYLENKI